MNVIQKFTTRVSKYGFDYVMKVILRNKVYRHVDNAFMAKNLSFTILEIFYIHEAYLFTKKDGIPKFSWSAILLNQTYL